MLFWRDGCSALSVAAKYKTEKQLSSISWRSAGINNQIIEIMAQ